MTRVCLYTSDTAATRRLVDLGGPLCSGPVRWRVDFTAAPSAFYCDGHREWHREINPFHDPFVEVEESSS